MIRCCIISEILQKCLRSFQFLDGGQWTQRKLGDYQQVEHFPFREHFFCSQFSSLCPSTLLTRLLSSPHFYHARWMNRAISKLIKNDLYSVLDPMKVQKYRIYVTQSRPRLLKCRKKRWRMKWKIFHSFCITLVIMVRMSVCVYIASNTLFVQQDSYSIQTLELHFSITMRMQILYLRIEC